MDPMEGWIPAGGLGRDPPGSLVFGFTTCGSRQLQRLFTFSNFARCVASLGVRDQVTRGKKNAERQK